MYFTHKYLKNIWVIPILIAIPEASSAQIADSWSIAGDTTVSAANTDTTILLTASDGALMSSPTIEDGARNTISASAVGATASVSYASASSQDTAITDTVDGGVAVSAANLGSSVSVIGTVDGVSIGLGHDNSVALSAVGASAQLGIVDSVLGGATVSRSLGISGDITLDAQNSDAVTLQTDVEGIDISGGTRNAFSATALGASTSLSVLAVVDDGAYSSDISIADGGQISLTANNSGDVLLGSTDDPNLPATVNGAALSADSVDGTISFTAIGANGSVSSTSVIYSGTADPSVTFGDVTFDVTNTGNVQANVDINDAVVEGKNSITAGAIGSTTSNSTKTISYVDGTFGVTGTMGAVTYASANSGSIQIIGGLNNAGITSGSGLAIALNAIGASTAFTLP
jgi:hypothetical protein